jgi:arylsulfatase A-like enzyme
MVIIMTHLRRLAAISMIFYCQLNLRAQTATSARAHPRPNVLFIMADQWRAQAFGYAGDPNVKTPNFDQLASESVNFRLAVASMPVCSPTRASLLTGRRAIEHGIFLNDAHLADDETTLAECFATAGYGTAMIGKWHLDGHGRQAFIPRERRQGFDYWKVLECTHAYNHSIYYSDCPEQLTWQGYDALAQTADAQQYIKDHARSDKPFLLCLWWGPPHSPYTTAPKKYQAMYDPAALQLRPNVPEADAETARKELAGYYAHCSALDDCLGSLRKTLSDAGIEKDTLIIFTSDHGDMLRSQGMERKQKPWDESIRVPMLWHYPAALGKSGKSMDAVMCSEDVMPTLLSIAGIDIRKSVTGLDYFDYMKGGANPNAENASLISCVAPFGEFIRSNGGREYRGIRTPRYSYVRDLNGPWLLYDNELDPFQLRNLANDDSSADIRAKLEATLNAKLKAAGDTFEPADFYLKKWGYADRVNANGTLPTRP